MHDFLPFGTPDGTPAKRPTHVDRPKYLVRKGGFEPPQCFHHWNLNPTGAPEVIDISTGRVCQYGTQSADFCPFWDTIRDTRKQKRGDMTRLDKIFELIEEQAREDKLELPDGLPVEQKRSLLWWWLQTREELDTELIPASCADTYYLQVRGGWWHLVDRGNGFQHAFTVSRTMARAMLSGYIQVPLLCPKSYADVMASALLRGYERREVWQHSRQAKPKLGAHG